MHNGPLFDPVPVWVDAQGDSLLIRCASGAGVSPEDLPAARAFLGDWLVPVSPEAMTWVGSHADRILPPALVALGRPRGPAVIEPEVVPQCLHGHPPLKAKKADAQAVVAERGPRCWTCGRLGAIAYRRWRYDTDALSRSLARIEMMCLGCHQSRHIFGYNRAGVTWLAHINAWTGQEVNAAVAHVEREWARVGLDGGWRNVPPPPKRPPLRLVR